MHRCAQAIPQKRMFEFNELEGVEELRPLELNSMSRFKNGSVPIWAGGKRRKVFQGETVAWLKSGGSLAGKETAERLLI